MGTVKGLFEFESSQAELSTLTFYKCTLLRPIDQFNPGDRVDKAELDLDSMHLVLWHKDRCAHVNIQFKAVPTPLDSDRIAEALRYLMDEVDDLCYYRDMTENAKIIMLKTQYDKLLSEHPDLCKEMADATIKRWDYLYHNVRILPSSVAAKIKAYCWSIVDYAEDSESTTSADAMA